MRKIEQLLILAFLLSFPALGQQRQVDKAGAAQVQTLLADEQVRLVHSQPWYAAGERLWFKAVVNKNSTRPPSRVLYVELQDAKGSALVNQRLVVEGGMASGDILLPKELPSGSYTLRAATSWMKNFSDKQQYREQLLIVNTREVVALQGREAGARPLQVQFFPESNSLLAGVTTQVAVVVTNAAGIGVAAQGTIENAAGKKIASFESDSTGVGEFDVRVNAGEQYVAQVQARGYQAQRVTLPEAKQEGLSMAVTGKSKEGIRVNVRNTKPWTYNLVAESGGRVYYSHSARLSGILPVPWQAKPGEAVRLLLLNPGGLVEAEQMVMLPQEGPDLQVSLDRQQYGTRQQVTVTLQGPPQANVAVAVTGQRPDFHRPLASNPAVWGRLPQDRELLVHAADGGLWDDILQGRSEGAHQPEVFVTAFTRDGETAPAAAAAFSTLTDTAFVQALPASVVSYAQQHHNRTQIEELYGLSEPHATAPLHRLPADRVFKLDDYITFNSVEEAIKEVTTNVRMSKKKGRQTVRLLYVRDGTKRMMKKEPLYLLDGVVVDGMEEMLALDLNDIASIEIAWTEEKLYESHLGHMSENGMFAVYTKSGEARERLKEKGFPVLYGQYNLPRVFVSSINTNGDAAEAGKLPDFKQLVFWEPQLQLDARGQASFTFFTSDETGPFSIQVQGQTSGGVPVSGEAAYRVKLVN